MDSRPLAPVPGLDHARSIVDVLQWRALQHGPRVACTFLADGEGEEVHLTYADLDARARGVAAHLSEAGARGERALLFLPTGPDFLAAFFGCLYAGTVAVPFYPLRRRAGAQARAVIEDAGARIALTTADGCARLARDEGARALRSFAVDRIAPSADAAPSLAPRPIDDAGIAYLQYTSGSTRRPRGVTVRHGQLLQHAGLLWRSLNQNEHSLIFSWLPLFHDMGLVGSLVAPLAFGRRVVLMSPWHFLTKPARWLAGISRYRATSSGAPNFAYDLCVARTTPDDRQGLDLGSWTTAFNGGEPVRAATLDRFVAAFAPHGFSRTAFRPCYGLAEATLLVTAGGGAAPPIVAGITRKSLETGRIEAAVPGQADTTALVGCGRSQDTQQVLIVDSESGEPVADRTVGEIWVAGPGLSTHYWNDAGDAPVFGARTSRGEGPFLRTGDLGFLDGGELFVTGRLKDLLIIRGRNYHAADLEDAILGSHPALAATRAAAFSVDRDAGEELVAVQEVPRTLPRGDLPLVVRAIRRTLATEFGLNAASIVMVRPGGIPRTSSGKTMRYACRDQFLAGGLPVVPVPERDGEASQRDRQPIADAAGSDSYPAVLDRLRRKLAAVLELEPAAVHAGRTFAEFGLSSLQLADLAGDLERESGRTLDPSVLYSYPTLDLLARYLTGEDTGAATGAGLSAAEPIAITGLACRFPGAPDAGSFWELLRDGRDAITEVPPDRWNVDEHYDPTLTRAGTTNTKWGGFLPRVDLFDSAFFSISGPEADSMDPQQRLLLEASWDALEDAGLPLERVKGTRTGVFVGISTNDYSRATSGRARTDLFWCTGSALSMAANRVSYCLDLQGPSLAIDTACSSSLVALHLACRSLRSGESELALVGGVNVMLSPEITINMSQAGATSADGRCKAFDAGADGLVRGEGVGVIVLKPLGRALADEDRIYAVVRGTAVNQDGATNGLTAPNPRAQAAVIRAAYEDAGVPPESVQYVETHGPGTVLGDPIELDALASVVSGTARTEACRVGSVKTNIGHLEAAAGVAAVIKVALALRHEQMPPSLHFRAPNPRIPFGALKLSVVTGLEPWAAADGEARRAGVSAFGFGGTNAHAVLESAPRVPSRSVAAVPTEPFHILQLSARGKPAVKAAAAAYADHLAQPADAPIALLTRAAAQRRTRQSHRLAIVGQSAREIAQRLERFLDDNPDRLVHWGEPVDGAGAGPVFAFSGFEAAPAGRFRTLLKHPAFRDSVDACDAMTRQLAGWSIAESFERESPDDHDPDSGLMRSQMRLFTLQIALAALWRGWGVEPAAVVGHSVGEIAAAHVAGAIDLSGAFLILHQRSRLLEDHLARSPGQGAMAAIGLSAAETLERLAAFGGAGGARLQPDVPIEVAAHNGPTLTVCAGERRALDRFLAALTGTGVHCRMLTLPGPGHTSFVEPLQQQLVDSLAALVAGPSRVPLFSSLTGAVCDGRALDGAYWGRHMRAHVSFVEATEAAVRSGHRLFLEIGLQGALSPCIAGVLRVRKETGVAVPSIREQSEPHESLAAAAAQLYVSGCPVSWGEPQRTPWTPLPGYPWQRRRHWSAPAAPIASRPAPAARSPFLQRLATALESVTPHPFLGVRLPGPPPVVCWQRDVDADTDWLRNHRVGGMALMPATAYLKLAAEAAREAEGVTDLVIEDVEFERALFVPPGETRVLQTTLRAHDAGGWRFDVHAGRWDGRGNPADWTRLAGGRVLAAARDHPSGSPDLAALRARPLAARDPAALYDGFRAHGIAYGPSFARIQTLWQLDDWEALAVISASGAGASSGLFDPGVLDACLQPMGLTISTAETAGTANGSGPAFLPARIRRAHIAGELPASLWSHVTRRSTSAAEPFEGDVTIFDDGGRVVASVEGFAVAATAPEMSCPPLRVKWHPREAISASRRAGSWIVVAGPEAIGVELVRLMQEAGVGAALTSAAEPLAAVLERVRDVAGIVDLRAASAAAADDDDGEGMARAVARTCERVLDTVRAAGGRGGIETPGLWIVTKNAVVVGPDDTPSPVQHPLWSLARTAAVEEARMWGGIVDLEAGSSDLQNARLLFSTLVEGDDEDQVAWRNGRRYVARLAPADPEPARHPSGLIRSSGTYLVTGGLGELGLQVAGWLVQQGARRLILLGRTGLPPRETWRGLQEGRARRAVEIIRALEARGASVHVAEVDVSSAQELADYLDGFGRDAWPEIAGVLHLAGVVKPAALRDVDESILMEHFAAKVAGAWNLHRYFAAAPLDFFVLFSSGSALLGSPGIGAYAAANAFLDALAATRRAEGRPAISINWGFWSESGMAARVLRTAPDRPVPRGMRGLTNREALGILGRLMTSRQASVAIMPFDWDEWSAAHPATAARRYLRLLTTARADVADDVSISRDEVLLARPEARAPILERYLTTRLARILNVDPATLERDHPLTQLGIDSLMAVELKNRVEADLRTSVPIVALLQGGTIAKLARVVLDTISDPTPAGAAVEPSPLEALSAEEARVLLAQLDQLPAATVTAWIDSLAPADEPGGRT